MAFFERQLVNFSALKATVKIEQLLESRGITLRRHGNKLIGPCPIHGGDNPSAFVVTPDKGLWYCFTRCASGGDVIELLRCMDRVDYLQAGRTLSILAGNARSNDYTLPLRQTEIPPNQTEFMPYVKKLYLDSAIPFLQRKGISSQTAFRFEAGAFRGRGMLAGTVAVRLHDPLGQPLGYAGRRIVSNQIINSGKWVFPPKLPKNRILYGYHHSAKNNPSTIAIVECPWGVMRLNQLKIPAVALLGISISSEQIKLLRRVQNIVLIMDGDSAGRSAANRLYKQLSQSFEIIKIDLPNQCDVDDLSDNELLSRLRSFFSS